MGETKEFPMTTKLFFIATFLIVISGNFVTKTLADTSFNSEPTINTEVTTETTKEETEEEKKKKKKELEQESSISTSDAFTLSSEDIDSSEESSPLEESDDSEVSDF